MCEMKQLDRSSESASSSLTVAYRSYYSWQNGPSI